MNKKVKVFSVLAVIGILGGLLLPGCSQNSVAGDTNKVVFGDWGVGPTCLAPFYEGIEDGYFKEQGLEVEHVRYPGMKEVYEALSLGKVDFAPVPTHLVNLLEEGFNVTGTLGIHPGCMQGIADINQPIYSVADLKGKAIGLDGLGHCPHAFSIWELAKAGISQDDVQFKVYAPPDLIGALKSGEVDAIVPLDPIGQLALDQGVGRRIFSTTYTEDGYSDVYCCTLTLNRDLVNNDPELAAAITQAVADAARAIPGHEDEVAQTMVDEGYTSGNPAVHAKLLKDYNFGSVSVQGAADALRYYGAIYKYAGILRQDTNIEDLIRKGFKAVIPEVGASTVPPPPQLPPAEGT